MLEQIPAEQTAGGEREGEWQGEPGEQPQAAHDADTTCFSTMLQIKCHASRWHS